MVRQIFGVLLLLFMIISNVHSYVDSSQYASNEENDISLSSYRNDDMAFKTHIRKHSSGSMEETAEDDSGDIFIADGTCGEGCSQCSSPTNCTLCDDPGAQINNLNGTCSCIDKNATLTDSSCVCTHGDTCTCNPFYFFNSTTGLCDPCSLTCSKCSEKAVCDECANPKEMKNNGNGVCSCSDPNSYFDHSELTCPCSPGFYNNTDGVCTACGLACKACSEKECTECYDPAMEPSGINCTCTDPNAEIDIKTEKCVCKEGYFEYIKNVCAACDKGCKNCTGYDECTECYQSDDTMILVEGICGCIDENAYIDPAIQKCVCFPTYYNNTENGICELCGVGCNTCTSDTACLLCVNSTSQDLSKDTGGCYCKDLTQWIDRFDDEQCQACPPGQYSNGDGLSCSLCSLGCEACSTFEVCDTCFDQQNQTNINGKCSCLDPNAYFDNLVDICACNDGFYNNDGKCEPCSIGCVTCKSPTSCSECWDIDNMLNKNDGTCFCKTSTDYPDPDTHTCTECPDGHFSRNDGSTCGVCGVGCQNCTSTTECTGCYDTNMNNVNGVCICQDLNAYIDTNTNQCTCNPGYYVNQDNGVCIACGSGCAQCNDDGSCNTCFDPTHMAAQANGTCVCKDGDAYFNDQKNVCECIPGYYTSQTGCTPCVSGCAICSSQTQCTQCFDQDRMKIDGTGGCECTDQNAQYNVGKEKCICVSGMFYSGNECTNCEAVCASCSDSNSCLTCQDSSNMNLSDGQCTCKDSHAHFDATAKKCLCGTGFYESDTGKCLSCDSTCASCNAVNSCQTCINSAIMKNNGDGTCSCDHKYKWDEKKNSCVKKSSGSSSSDSGSSLWWVWFLLSLFLVGGAVGGYYGYKYYKRRAWIRRQRSEGQLSSELDERRLN
ncbi:unnamed protein product [Blepharisma stoltei]|uniref:Insulin-like growth factor binding protein, N-terminal n=1 Tax=Blepharisma stoltei TaxID=1481888 RepID=A0AAU9IHR7_9CILI|nr:unnamed protein product [Blepharisma stoltei]